MLMIRRSSEYRHAELKPVTGVIAREMGVSLAHNGIANVPVRFVFEQGNFELKRLCISNVIVNIRVVCVYIMSCESYVYWTVHHCDS